MLPLTSRQAKEVWGADVDIEIDSGVSADDEDLNAMLMQGVSDSEVAKTEESVSGVSDSPSGTICQHDAQMTAGNDGRRLRKRSQFTNGVS